MFCKYCGAKIDEDSIFCNSCGKQVKVYKVNAEHAQKTEHKYATAPVNNKKDYNYVQPKAKKRSILSLLLGIAVIVILVVSIFSSIEPSEPPAPEPEALARPSNGEVMNRSSDYDSDNTSLITVKNESASDYYIKLTNKKGDKSYCEFYVRAGQTAKKKVQQKKMYLKYACGGTEWYGKKDYFGASSQFYKDETVYNFKEYTYTISLHASLEDGENIDAKYIDKADF